MNKTYIALNDDTGEDWNAITSLQIVALTDEQLEELEENPHFDEHPWCHEMTALHISDDGKMFLSVKQNGGVDHIDIGCLPQDIGRTYPED